MNTKELFTKFNDSEIDKISLKESRLLCAVLLCYTGLVWIINSNIIPLNPLFVIIGESAKAYAYYFFVLLSFFLVTSSNPKMKKLSNISFLITCFILLLMFLSYFHMFGLHNVINFKSKTEFFGLWNSVVLFSCILCMFLRKYENPMQIIALTSAITGFGGFLYYL